MAIKNINTDELAALSLQHPVIDVRSPAEYAHAHIPRSYNLPLFDNEERKIVGTAYKQESREKAIRLGLDFFGVKMRGMVEATEKIKHALGGKKNSGQDENEHDGVGDSFIVHCWRGGMRSSAVAWLLDFYGYKVYLLQGGYKAFRNWVLHQFENQYEFNILSGYTGSGKTELLKELQVKGQHIIDLEALANHKGSAFGGIGQPAQPTQEMFENLLAAELHQKEKNLFWMEDESQRMGILNIPNSIWNAMRKRPVYFIEIPFKERLKHIVSSYGLFEKEFLINSILRIKKKLGPKETKDAIGFLVEDNIEECFRILLSYYDKLYEKSLHQRENLSLLLNNIPCQGVDAVVNLEKLFLCNIVNT